MVSVRWWRGELPVMCGICGYSLGPNDSPPDLNLMLSRLAHRGPDDEGKIDDGSIAIAMRRLAIIDVAGGHQPMSNESGTVWVVQNGEIYNYRDLRNELKQQGHTFRTQSDTEVLVRLYEQHGREMLGRLRGMFSICVYDRRDHSLFLARDPFGEKPLFYARTGSRLVFSSEVRSLIDGAPDIPRNLDYEALSCYLRADLVPAPLTMFRAVRQVRPGSWLHWRDGQLNEGSYFTPDYREDPRLSDEDDAEVVVEEALRLAVSRQLVGERPLGAFLSAGIDSGTIASLCQEIQSEPIKTFTVGFQEPGYDESGVAAQVAKQLGTQHREFTVQGASFHPDMFWRIIDHVGVPFTDTSAIPTHIISRAAAQHVTVALSGDGGDEMFGGYPDFRRGLAIRRLSRLPGPALRAGERLAGYAGKLPKLGSLTGVRRTRRALQMAQARGMAQFVALNALFEPNEIDGLTVAQDLRDALNAPLTQLESLPDAADEWSPLKRLMYYRMRYVLPEDMLVKVDRMSMSCSLEVRAPYLDLDLARLVMTLPDRHFIRGNEQKYILRKIARRRLPEAVFNRPKSGFSIPIHTTQNDEYRMLAQELLAPDEGIMSLFDPASVATLKAKALDGRTDDATASVYRTSHQLWALMQLSAWARRFGVAA